MLHQLYELVRMCTKDTGLLLLFVHIYCCSCKCKLAGLQARSGTRICYVPGNHDEAARAYLTDEAVAFGNVEVRAPRQLLRPLRLCTLPSTLSSPQCLCPLRQSLAYLDVQVVQETMHTCADGRRFLVLHGDRCSQALLDYYTSRWTCSAAPLSAHTWRWLD